MFNYLILALLPLLVPCQHFSGSCLMISIYGYIAKVMFVVAMTVLVQTHVKGFLFFNNLT